VFTKICTVCLKSGILCPRCDEKVQSGEISPLDLEVAKTLVGMEGKYPALQKVHFHKSVESGNSLIILVDKKDSHLIQNYGGKILRDIAEKVKKKKVRVLGYNEGTRRFLESLFAPASILTINTIWLPDGSTETKVILPKRDLRKLPANMDALKDLAKNIRNITLRIEFESF
jgi:transcription antitermination factor NusA-like protein